MEDTVVSAGVKVAAGAALAAGLLLAGLLAHWLLQGGPTAGAEAERPGRPARRGLLLAIWTGVAVATLYLAPDFSHPGEVPPDPLAQAVSYAGYLAFYAAGLLVLGPLLRRRAARRGKP